MTEPESENKDLSVIEVAARLDVTRATISLWCRKKKFPNAYKVSSLMGEYWMIPESDLHGVEIRMGRPKKK